MTTLRALTIVLSVCFVGWVCVTDQLPDAIGLLLLVGFAVFAVRTPHINERMSR